MVRQKEYRKEENIMTGISRSHLFVLDYFPFLLAFFSWLIEEHQSTSAGLTTEGTAEGLGLIAHL